MEGNIRFLQAFDNLLAQSRAIRIGEIAVRYTTLGGIVEGVDAALGEVQHVVANYEVTCLHLRVEGTDCGSSKNLLSSQALHRPDVGTIVYLVGRHGMIYSVTAHENNLITAHCADVAQCFTKRCFYNLFFESLQGIGIINTGSANDSNFTHMLCLLYS